MNNSSLITVKLASPESNVPCYKFEPTDKMFKDAKKGSHDLQHSSLFNLTELKYLDLLPHSDT